MARAVRGEAAAEAGAQVDNLEAGGFFARFGREREGPRATVIPPTAAPAPPVPASPADGNRLTLGETSHSDRDRDSDSDSASISLVGLIKVTPGSNNQNTEIPLLKYQYQYH